MADFERYEFVVKPKRDAKNKLLRVFLVLFYISFVLLCLVFGFLTGFVPLLALVPLVLWIIIFFTWRYVNLEYEYVEKGSNDKEDDEHQNRPYSRNIHQRRCPGGKDSHCHP